MSEDRTSGRNTATEISNDQIRERAYEIWERHHRPEGFGAHFWLLAKQELLAEHKELTEMDIAGDHNSDPQE
jgi:hypothetical protein